MCFESISENLLILIVIRICIVVKAYEEISSKDTEKSLPIMSDQKWFITNLYSSFNSDVNFKSINLQEATYYDKKLITTSTTFPNHHSLKDVDLSQSDFITSSLSASKTYEEISSKATEKSFPIVMDHKWLATNIYSSFNTSEIVSDLSILPEKTYYIDEKLNTTASLYHFPLEFENDSAQGGDYIILSASKSLPAGLENVWNSTDFQNEIKIGQSTTNDFSLAFLNSTISLDGSLLSNERLTSLVNSQSELLLSTAYNQIKDEQRMNVLNHHTTQTSLEHTKMVEGESESTPKSNQHASSHYFLYSLTNVTDGLTATPSQVHSFTVPLKRNEYSAFVLEQQINENADHEIKMENEYTQDVLNNTYRLSLSPSITPVSKTEESENINETQITSGTTLTVNYTHYFYNINESKVFFGKLVYSENTPCPPKVLEQANHKITFIFILSEGFNKSRNITKAFETNLREFFNDFRCDSVVKLEFTDTSPYIFSWSNFSLPTRYCNKGDIQEIVSKIIHPEGHIQEDILLKFINSSIVPQKATLEYTGVCKGRLSTWAIVVCVVFSLAALPCIIVICAKMFSPLVYKTKKVYIDESNDFTLDGRGPAILPQEKQRPSNQSQQSSHYENPGFQEVDSSVAVDSSQDMQTTPANLKEDSAK